MNPPPPAAPVRRPPAPRGPALVVERADRYPVVTRLAVLATAAGAALAALGLPPADVHGPLHYVGIMDPLCGLTRSVRFAFRAQIAAAWRYNPLGPLLAVPAVLALLRAGVGSATGRWPAVRLSLLRRARRVLWLLAFAAAAALQVRQQSIAALLAARR